MQQHCFLKRHRSFHSMTLGQGNWENNKQFLSSCWMKSGFRFFFSFLLLKPFCGLQKLASQLFDKLILCVSLAVYKEFDLKKKTTERKKKKIIIRCPNSAESQNNSEQKAIGFGNCLQRNKSLKFLWKNSDFHFKHLGC